MSAVSGNSIAPAAVGSMPMLAGHVCEEPLFEHAKRLRSSMFHVAKSRPKTVASNHAESFEHQADRIKLATAGERSKQQDRHAQSRPLTTLRPIQDNTVLRQPRKNVTLDV